MLKTKLMACACALALLLPCLYIKSAAAADNGEMQQLRDEIAQMKHDYEARIQSLEARLQQTETTAAVANKTAEAASVQAEAASTQAASPATSSNAFNPDISLILSGIYEHRSRDSNFHISNFQAGGEVGPGKRGFSLTESELGVYASVDHYFYGGLNLALAEDNSVSVEEAFIQTTALPYGVTLKAGRFFSGIGYLNEQHAHTWDFVDSPLAYQAFLGSQFGDDGVQLKWVAPTDTFIELGGEYGRGRIADTEGRDQNGGGGGSLFGHVGGDIGASSNWRAGLSYLQVAAKDRQSNDLDAAGNYVTNNFTGDSHVWIADAVWKWAPNGNNHDTSFKLQGEYLHRDEDGKLNTDQYSASQSGWYVQAVYKFLPEWRTGVRYDRLDGGSVSYGANTSGLAINGYDPQRISWMLDFNPSEFSRIRLQLAHDESREEAPDNQIFIQYQMSLGAHGAHKY